MPLRDNIEKRSAGAQPQAPATFQEYMSQIKNQNQIQNRTKDTPTRREQRSLTPKREMNFLDKALVLSEDIAEEVANPLDFDYERDNPVSNPIAWAATLPGGIASAPANIIAKAGAGFSGSDIYTADKENNMISSEALNTAERAASIADAAISGFGVMAGGTGALLRGGGRLAKSVAGKAIKEAADTGAKGVAKNVFGDATEEFFEETAQSYLGNIEEGVEFDTGAALLAGAYGALGGGVMSGTGMALDAAARNIQNKKNPNVSEAVGKTTDLWNRTFDGIDESKSGLITDFAKNAMLENVNDKVDKGASTGTFIADNNLGIDDTVYGIQTLKGMLEGRKSEKTLKKADDALSPFLGEPILETLNARSEEDASDRINDAITKYRAAGNEQVVEIEKAPRTGLSFLFNWTGVRPGGNIYVNGAMADEMNADFDGDMVKSSMDPGVDYDGRYISNYPSSAKQSVVNGKDPLNFDMFYNIAISKKNKAQMKVALMADGLDDQAYEELYEATHKAGSYVDARMSGKDSLVEQSDYNAAMNEWLRNTSSRLGGKVAAKALQTAYTAQTNYEDVADKAYAESGDSIRKELADNFSGTEPDLATGLREATESESGTIGTPGNLNGIDSTIVAAIQSGSRSFSGSGFLAIRLAAAEKYKKNDADPLTSTQFDQLVARSMGLQRLGHTATEILETTFSTQVWNRVEASLNGRKIGGPNGVTGDELLSIFMEAYDLMVPIYNSSMERLRLSGAKVELLTDPKKSKLENRKGAALAFGRMFPDLSMDKFGFVESSVTRQMNLETYMRYRNLSPYHIGVEVAAMDVDGSGTIATMFDDMDDQFSLTSDRIEDAIDTAIEPITRTTINVVNGVIDVRDEAAAMERASAIQNIIGEKATLDNGVLGPYHFIENDLGDLFLSNDPEDIKTLIIKLKLRSDYKGVNRLKEIYNANPSEKTKDLLIREAQSVQTTATHAFISQSIEHDFNFRVLEVMTRSGQFPNGYKAFRTEMAEMTRLYGETFSLGGMFADAVSGGSSKIELAAMRENITKSARHFRVMHESSNEVQRKLADDILKSAIDHGEEAVNNAIKNLGREHNTTLDLKIIQASAYDSLYLTSEQAEKNLNDANMGSLGEMKLEQNRGHLKSEMDNMFNATLRRFNVSGFANDRKKIWGFLYGNEKMSFFLPDGKTAEDKDLKDLLIHEGIIKDRTVSVEGKHMIALYRRYPALITWMSEGIITASPLQDGTAATGSVTTDYIAAIDAEAQRAKTDGTNKKDILKEIERKLTNTPAYLDIVLHNMAYHEDDFTRFLGKPEYFSMEFYKAHTDVIEYIYNATARIGDTAQKSAAADLVIETMLEASSRVLLTASDSYRKMGYSLNVDVTAAASDTEQKNMLVEIINQKVNDLKNKRIVDMISSGALSKADGEALLQKTDILIEEASDIGISQDVVDDIAEAAGIVKDEDDRINALRFYVIKYFSDIVDQNVASISSLAISPKAKADLAQTIEALPETTPEEIEYKEIARNVLQSSTWGDIDLVANLNLDDTGLDEYILSSKDIESSYTNLKGSPAEAKLIKIVESGVVIPFVDQEEINVKLASTNPDEVRDGLYQASRLYAKALFAKEYRKASSSKNRVNVMAMDDALTIANELNDIISDLRSELPNHAPLESTETIGRSYNLRIPRFNTSLSMVKTIATMAQSAHAGATIQHGVSSAGYKAKITSAFGGVITSNTTTTEDNMRSKFVRYSIKDLVDSEDLQYFRNQTISFGNGNTRILDDDGEIDLITRSISTPDADVYVAVPWRTSDIFDEALYSRAVHRRESHSFAPSLWMHALLVYQEETLNLTRKKNLDTGALIAELENQALEGVVGRVFYTGTGQAIDDQTVSSLEAQLFDVRKTAGIFYHNYAEKAALGTESADAFILASTMINGFVVNYVDGTSETIAYDKDTSPTKLKALDPATVLSITPYIRSIDEVMFAVSNNMAHRTKIMIDSGTTSLSDKDIDGILREGILSTEKRLVGTNDLLLSEVMGRISPRSKASSIDPVLASNTTPLIEWDKQTQDKKTDIFSIEQGVIVDDNITGQLEKLSYNITGDDKYNIVNASIEEGTPFWVDEGKFGATTETLKNNFYGLDQPRRMLSNNRTDLFLAAIKSEEYARDAENWVLHKGVSLAIPENTPADRYISSKYKSVGDMSLPGHQGKLNVYRPSFEQRRTTSGTALYETAVYRITDDKKKVAPVIIAAVDKNRAYTANSPLVYGTGDNGVYGRTVGDMGHVAINLREEFSDVVGTYDVVQDDATINYLSENFEQMLTNGTMILPSYFERRNQEAELTLLKEAFDNFNNMDKSDGMTEKLNRRGEIMGIMVATPVNGSAPVYMPLIQELNGFPNSSIDQLIYSRPGNGSVLSIMAFFDDTIDGTNTRKGFVFGTAIKGQLTHSPNVPQMYLGGQPISIHMNPDSSITRAGGADGSYSDMAHNMFWYTRIPDVSVNAFMQLNPTTGVYEPDMDKLSDSLTQEQLDSLSDPESNIIPNLFLTPGSVVLKDPYMNELVRRVFLSASESAMKSPMALFNTTKNIEIDGKTVSVNNTYGFEESVLLEPFTDDPHALLRLFHFIDPSLCPDGVLEPNSADYVFTKTGRGVIKQPNGTFDEVDVFIDRRLIGTDTSITDTASYDSTDGMQSVYMENLYAPIRRDSAERFASHIASLAGYSAFEDRDSLPDDEYMAKLEEDLNKPTNKRIPAIPNVLSEIKALYGDSTEGKFLANVERVGLTFSHRIPIDSDTLNDKGQKVPARSEEISDMVGWFNQQLGYGADSIDNRLTTGVVLDIVGAMVGRTYINNETDYSVSVTDARILLGKFVDTVKNGEGDTAYPIQYDLRFDDRRTLSLMPEEHMRIMYNIPIIKNKFNTYEAFLTAGKNNYNKAVAELSSMNEISDGKKYLKQKGALIEYSAYLAFSNSIPYDVQARLWGYRTIQDVVTARNQATDFFGITAAVDEKFGDNMENVNKALARLKAVEETKIHRSKGVVIGTRKPVSNVAKVLSNILVGNMLFNPIISSSNTSHRLIGQRFRAGAMRMGEYLGIGPYTGGLRPSPQALAIAKNDPRFVLLWMVWNDNAFNSEDTEVMLQLSEGGVEQALAWADARKDLSWSSRYRDFTARLATGWNIGINKQMELFLRRFFYLSGKRGGSVWTEQMMNEMLSTEGGVSNWLSSVFNRDVPHPDLVNVLQARQWSLGSDMNQKNILSELYRLMTQNYPVAQLGTQALLTPFVQYQFNRAGRVLQKVLPMSSLNFIAVRIAMKVEDTTGNYSGIMWEELQTQESIKEAAILDVMHIGAFNLALILAAAAWFEPPEDESLINNYKEWTILGFRIADAWPIDDILGITLPLACFWKSASMGKANTGVLFNGISDAIASNPIMEIGALTEVLTDPATWYEEEYVDEIDMWSDIPGGIPSVIDVALSTMGRTGGNIISKFLMPTFIDSVVREMQPYEVSYKRIYEVDATGRPTGEVNETSGARVTQEVGYFDAQLRSVTRNHFTLGLLANLVTGVMGRQGTGYTAGEMPNVVLYDPYEMGSMRYFSMYQTEPGMYDYATDASGERIRKSDQQLQAMVLEVEGLLSTEDPATLRAQGFFMDSETKSYVSKTLWDQLYAVDGAMDEWKASDAADWYNLSPNDPYGEGRQIWYDTVALFENEKTRIKGLYDILWSYDLRQSMTTYNRYNTTWDQDANGEWYATGYRRNPLQIIATAPIDGNMGSASNWETESEVVDGATTGMRALEPVRTQATEYRSIDDWAGEDGGYSDIYPGNNYSNTTDDGGNNSNGSGGSGWRSYGGGGGGGGGGYAPNLYSHLPNTPYIDTRTMTADRLYDTQYDYLRPSFETKGSRESYKREDI